MHRLEKEIRQINVDMKKLANSIGVVTFAKLVGMSKTTISSWLSGRREFSYKKILQVADKIK